MLHLTVNLMRLSATFPSAASVRRWLNQGCQEYCSLPEHYAASAALHTSTELYLKQLPAWRHGNLATRPNTDYGGRQRRRRASVQRHGKRQTLLKYMQAVTPPKFRLPTWHLHTTKPYDSTQHQSPPDSIWFVPI